MKKIFAAAIVILIYASAAFAADPAEGFWLSVDQRTGKIESSWEIYQDNGYLYGKLISGIGISSTDKAVKCRENYANYPIAGKVNQLPLLGSPWIFGLHMEGPGKWSNGSVINPSDGNMYKCSIIYHPADGKKFKQEALEVKGQLLFFSGSQYWRRATREEAIAIK